MNLEPHHYAEALRALTDKLNNEYELSAAEFENIASAAKEIKWKLEELRDER